MADHSRQQVPHRTALSVAALAVVVVLLAAGQFLRDDSLAGAQRAGRITIGYAVEAPYAFLTDSGEVTGESPEVAKAIVAKLGLGQIAWRQAPFGALIAELEEGRIDVIAAGMFITADRAKRVTFSDPTFRVRPGLLTPRGNPRRLTSYQQAAAVPDAKIAALSGSVEEALLRRLGLPAERLVLVPDALTGRASVESGLADALALSSPTVQWMALGERLGRTERVAMADPLPSAGSESFGYGAFAFRRGDRALRDAWNAGLRTYLGSEAHRALVAQFGFTSAELPGPITVEEVLARAR